MKPTEATMRKRRLERLSHVTFFMTNERAKGLETSLGRPAALNLLTGWFGNSHWRTAWWVFTQAIDDSYERVRLRVFLFWHCTIMKRTDEELEKYF